MNIVRLETTAVCRICGELRPKGRRTLDSTAEDHTKTHGAGHFTFIWSVPVHEKPATSK